MDVIPLSKGVRRPFPCDKADDKMLSREDDTRILLRETTLKRIPSLVDLHAGSPGHALRALVGKPPLHKGARDGLWTFSPASDSHLDPLCMK